MEGQKIELLRKAANAVIDHLRPGDRVGILTFNQAFQWTAPIQIAADKPSLKQVVAGIYPNGGTKIPEALKEGCDKMLPVDAAFRHIVLLTDGISDERDSEQTAKDAADRKVTISTIGLGTDVNRAFLEKIAARGAGQSYFLNDPDALEQTMLDDVQEFTGAR
jgi:secreted protein with Ig-like and vWFA domain